MTIQIYKYKKITLIQQLSLDYYNKISLNVFIIEYAKCLYLVLIL
jgi:hypothetical protein